jgi:hypothetical protein
VTGTTGDEVRRHAEGQGQGPSGTAARWSRSEPYSGVDAIGNSRQEPCERARKLGVKGRSRMTKGELAKAIGRKQ